MTSMNHSSPRQKIIDKVRKCLALAGSASEHEAAAALRQAQKLMEAHGIDAVEVKASEVQESAAHAGASRTPSSWETYLCTTVGDAFGCEVIFMAGYGSGKWNFVGVGISAEIAQYAFTVLFRQLRRCRTTYIKEKCKRIKPANKTRRADLYCKGWVYAVESKVRALAINPERDSTIAAFMGLHYPEMGKFSPRDRNDGRKASSKDIDAIVAGVRAGDDAHLSHGIAGDEMVLIEAAA
ncbi:DUF2786 domain-containing protein [Herbaspirillum sp.]|uniref:DUF2786 domain-containing protein n=1 Tax=Herbaspirillum sp. TaxID=1890675 RepID=UPI001B25BB74|nr:DUF2786 domain-containing protein [Herbaspirillum sp.]MBO9538755.1 DUF2786 domain-containing protein [Herbaspirillum sp.]